MASNPFINDGTSTPLIPDLVGGADAFGLTSLSSTANEFNAVRFFAPDGAIAALLRFDTGPSGYGDNFVGHDALILINLKDAPIAGPGLGAGGSHMQALLEGGFANSPDFGGSGPSILSSLAANAVYLTLIPSALTEVTIAGDGAVEHYTSFVNESIRYLTPAPPGDFNGDGNVDTVDYVLWRKGLGSAYTQNDYNIWRANFGQTASGAIASLAVPETLSLLMLVPAILAGTIRFRAARSCRQFD
jgi:hypothetical protein